MRLPFGHLHAYGRAFVKLGISSSQSDPLMYGMQNTLFFFIQAAAFFISGLTGNISG